MKLQKLLCLIYFSETFVNGAYVAPKTPITLMNEIADNYRTLNCWQCFEAQGKMCHDKNNASLIKVTGSSNPGHAVCCKAKYFGDHCETKGNTVCS